MTVLSIILGVLMILGGIACMFTPVATFLATGYFFGILLLVYGIVGIIRGIQKQAKALEVVISVLAVIAGLFCIFRPGTALEFDRIALYLIAAWFVLQGVLSIVMSLQAKDTNKNWFWGLIVGILGIVVGVYAFAHPMVTAISAGFLIGFFFIQTGIDMIVLAAAVDDMDDGI